MSLSFSVPFYILYQECKIIDMHYLSSIRKLIHKYFIIKTLFLVLASLTCSYMRNIGTSGLSALTLDQINNLDDTEFTDCIDILGAVTDYSDAQKQALADVGKRNTVSIYVCYISL